MTSTSHVPAPAYEGAAVLHWAHAIKSGPYWYEVVTRIGSGVTPWVAHAMPLVRGQRQQLLYDAAILPSWMLTLPDGRVFDVEVSDCGGGIVVLTEPTEQRVTSQGRLSPSESGRSWPT